MGKDILWVAPIAKSLDAITSNSTLGSAITEQSQSGEDGKTSSWTGLTFSPFPFQPVGFESCFSGAIIKGLLNHHHYQKEDYDNCDKWTNPF